MSHVGVLVKNTWYPIFSQEVGLSLQLFLVRGLAMGERIGTDEVRERPGSSFKSRGAKLPVFPGIRAVPHWQAYEMQDIPPQG